MFPGSRFFATYRCSISISCLMTWRTDVMQALPVPTLRVVLDSDSRADSTLTFLTIQVIQLWLNSNHKFANFQLIWVRFESNLTHD